MSILVSPPLDPSSSTSSSSSSLASLPPQKERRIRFAPLPIPPCDNVEDEEECIQEHDADLEQIREDDEITLDNNGKFTTGNGDCIHTESLDDSKCAYYDEGQRSASPYRSKPTTQQLLSHSPVAHPPTWSAPKLVNLFRPFPFRRSSPPTSTHSLTPTVSIDDSATPTNASRASLNSKRRKSISPEEILTLGAINLFRPSSKHSKDGGDSRRNSGSSWASSLWSGGSSSNLHSSRSSSPTFPRTSSMQSTQSNMSSRSKLGSAITTTKPRSSSVSSNASTSSAPSTSRPSTKAPRRPKSADATAPSKRGIRMLNGRVYGSKRNRGNVNHFANIKDEEPSFVEWGYGGMGSVKGGKHAGVANHWDRLHGTAATAGGDKVADDDDDDGTGMAWVKRRKEQREREKAEKEAKEKAEAEAAKAAESKPAEDATPETTEESKEAHTSTEPAPEPSPEPSPSPPVEKELHAPSTSIKRPSSSSSSSAHSGAPSAFPSSPAGPSTPQLEHNLEAISIPASHNRRHKHGRSVSRTSSLDATVSSNGHAPLSSSPIATVLAAPSPLSQLPVKEQPAESESEEEESDAELNRQGDDEETDEEEEEEMTQQALQALCAGVEKVSRHHENN